MNKSNVIFLVVVFVVFAVFTTILFCLLRLQTQNTFLMKLAQLESASIGEYESAFGKPLYIIHYGEPFDAALMSAIDGQFSEGQNAFFFPVKTVPFRFLIVIGDKDGRAVSRTWAPM